MTNAEIKKALECCAKETADCENCPANREFVYWQCFDEVKILAVDLINRQVTEIERLKKGWKADVMLTANVKTEAYKECVEKAKEELHVWVGADNSISYSRITRVLDNLLKELEGGDDNAQ